MNQDSSGSRADSLLVFGSLALSFDASSFRQLQKAVAESVDVHWLADLISTLPEELEHVLVTFPTAQPLATKARKHLQDLHDAFSTGCPLESAFPLSNILLIPLVVIHQLTQYAAFVRSTSVEPDSRVDIFASARSRRETIGLCTGSLSAFAVSSARNDSEFRQYGSTAVRLGMLIGLVIDAQEETRSLSVTWLPTSTKEELQRIVSQTEKAYISVHYDESRVTVTCPSSTTSPLAQQLRDHGYLPTSLGLRGAFHCPENAAIVDDLIAFVDDLPRYQFADPDSLAMPSWTCGASRISGTSGPLHSEALRGILAEPPWWHISLLAALGEEERHIVSFGPEDNIPPFLASKAHARHGEFSNRTLPRKERHRGRPPQADDIAVVGMACKVAGADDIDEFWDLLVAGKSQHREINKADIQSARFDFQDSAFRSTDDANMRRKWFANLMDGHDEFDHRFFKKSARESASMDPQQRQLLQVAYQAVEQSGYLRSAQTERDLNVGTFVGVCLTDYENNVASHPANAFTTTGNLQGFIAGKVSHFFGWTGPGLTIDTACSSSLVAVHQACQSILSGECDAALAGGSHILTSATWFQNLAAGSFLSPTGQCKPFDAKGDGYCRGEGVGAVFLKRMSKALEDNDQIIGCIAASAVQQNQSCTPIFVPNAPSLSDLFSKVVTKARVRPSQISYIEAHGTGTPVGDPAEYDGIRQVLGGARRSPEKPLTLGSVKGLVGHLECTSGIISLIKVLLMLNKGTLAPQASFDTLNPSLNAVAADNILIPTRPLAWDSDFRIALINNYGASGSNASMIVTEPPVRPRIDPSKQETASRQPFWLSATDAKGLERNVRKLRQYISQLDPSMTIENISYNLARRSNRALESRWIFSASSIPELERSLSSFDKTGASGASSNDSPVVLCFGGQVSNFIGLDQNLYDRVANLRYHIDAVDSVVCSLGYDSILPSIFQRSPIADTVRLQCALFATQYAFARTWLDAGIRPAALVGHSFGELTALCISQMLSLEDTVRLIASRAALVRDAWGDDHGTMIAAEADRGDIEAVLNTANGSHKDVPASIACYNGPTSSTIAGSTAAIEAVRTELQRTPMQRVRYKDLSVTNAFHSALVDPICEQLEEVARGLKFRQPVIHLEHATQERLSSPLTARFVADHMRKPVCFQQAVERVVEKLGSSSCTFLEAGTNSTVTNMVRRVFSNSNEHKGHTYQAVNVANVEDGFNRLTDLTCSLWKGGLNVQHWTHHARQWRFDPGLKSISLPPYQFDRDSKHWLDIQIAPKRHAKDAYPNVETTTPQPPKDEILRFSGYNLHGGRKVATYRLNTEMTEYSSVLAGHLTVGTAPICPATVQLAFVLETIGLERSDYSEGHEAQIQNVQYHCPLCQSPSRSTFIEVELVNTTTQQWRFEVLGVEATKSATRHSYTTGTVTFPRKDDQALKRELVRYGRLFGAHRATQLLECSDVDEVLTAQTLYRIFSEIVDYGDRFRGLRRLVNRGNESAGRVTRQSGSRLPFDPYLSDSFCQMGGIWINFVGEREPQDIYIANGIDHWLRAPVDSSEQSNEFIAFACHQRTAQASTTDVFVFDATTKTLVEAILGISYVRIPKLSMQKMLTRLTDPARLSKNLPAGVRRPVHNVPVDTTEDTSDPQALRPSYSSRYDETRAPTDASPKLPKTSNSGSSGVLFKIKRIIAELVGLDLDEVKDDSELADLGIDSLTGLELIHELETSFHTKLAQAEAFAVTNMPGLLNCVTQALGEDVDTAGTESSDDTDNTTPGASTSSSDEDSGTNSTTPVTRSDAGRDISDKTTSSMAFGTIMGAFRETKDLTDDRVVEYGQQDYSRSALPRQHELTVALTIEAFEKLGAGLTQAQPGEYLKHIPHGKEHRHLVSHLYRMLEAQTQVIIVDGESIVRTAVDMPKSSSREIYDDLLARYPDQVDADRLTYYAGVNLSRVLSGEIDGVKLIFGNPEGRQLASAFYAEWPLNKVVIAQMEDFLTRLANRLRANGEINEGTPLRIMEVGAGTGGTSRRIVPLLASLKIPVEYTFTDLAPSFVAAARKQWGKQYPFMKFRAYDVEKVPDADLKGTQHVVLASNAVHATHSLRDSTSNIRQILRDDGILLMMEMTRTPYWVDLIFGLFEGWWLFDDGRKHALSHESRWEADMYAAGYGIVDWTDGQRPETEIQKLIIAAASSTSSPSQRPRSSSHNSPPLARQVLTHGATSDREVDEVTVVEYVNELSKGFEAEIEKSGVVSQQGLESSMKGATSWIIVTGGTGGLGAHIVAEAAVREDVARVICLNRRSRSIDPRLRQEEAIRKKGILLGPDALAKIDIWVSELTKPDLGLDEDQHAMLAKHATHIIHNAWLMHFSWPLKRFEPQLRIMAHLLALAGRMSASRSHGNLVTFELVSSIATVGNQPVLSGNPVVLEERVCIEDVLSTGYAVAKYICERMLDATLHRHPSRFRATAVRLGQIAGSSHNGHWNSKEHVPFMIKSGQTVGSFPDLPGSMGWTPADVIAATLVDIATQPDDVLLYPIYHIENPTRQPWRDVATIITDELSAAGSERPEVVPFSEWIESVKNWPHALDNMPGGKNPSFTLVGFLDEHFLRMSCGGLLMATTKAREHSPALRKQGPLSELLIWKYIAAWRAEGFLT